MHHISEKTQVCYYGRMVKEPLPFFKVVKFSFIETKTLPPHISPFLKKKKMIGGILFNAKTTSSKLKSSTETCGN